MSWAASQETKVAAHINYTHIHTHFPIYTVLLAVHAAAAAASRTNESIKALSLSLSLLFSSPVLFFLSSLLCSPFFSSTLIRIDFTLLKEANQKTANPINANTRDSNPSPPPLFFYLWAHFPYILKTISNFFFADAKVETSIACQCLSPFSSSLELCNFGLKTLNFNRL